MAQKHLIWATGTELLPFSSFPEKGSVALDGVCSRHRGR